jgi:enoyl-CoA hydratase
VSQQPGAPRERPSRAGGVAPGAQRDRAVSLAKRIAEQAPLGVRATMLSARRAVIEGESAAAERLRQDVVELLESEDAREGMQSFLERRPAKFVGR